MWGWGLRAGKSRIIFFLYTNCGHLKLKKMRKGKTYKNTLTNSSVPPAMV
jgi:hypothetical protein